MKKKKCQYGGVEEDNSLCSIFIFMLVGLLFISSIIYLTSI